MTSNNILHKWDEPQPISDAKYRAFKKLAKKAVPRLLLITTVLMASVYLFLKNVSPDELDMDWDRLFPKFYLVTTFLICSMFALQVWQLKLSKVTYSITERGIIRRFGSKAPVLKWSAVKSYSISHSEPFPEITIVTLNAGARTKAIHLPDSAVTKEIIHTVSSFIPEQVEGVDRLQKVTLSSEHYLCLYACSVIYAVALGAYMSDCFFGDFNRSVTVLLLMTPLLGGGTLGVTILFGKKIFKEKQLIACACFFNMLTSTLAMLFFVMMAFYRFSQLLRNHQ